MLEMRLAFRAEGLMWNAYIAPLKGMEGAVLIGSVGLKFAQANPEIEQGFMDLMKKSWETFVGQKAEWNDPVKAPESERSGHA